MLSRIRNAVSVNKTEIYLPHSKTKQRIAEILTQGGFLTRVSTNKDEGYPTLYLQIRDERQPSPITEIERLSRPGRRLYVGADEIPIVKRGRGMVIISTNQGIMTGEQAKAKHLGGELICKVY
jgi:small subunit ribosomal protein S8